MSDKINNLIVRGARAAIDHHKSRADRAEAALRDAREALEKIEAMPAWGYQSTPEAVRQFARAALAALEPKP